MITAFGTLSARLKTSIAQRGVPRSTARSWLKEPNAEVVTADVLDMNALRLQQEILRLRIRVQKLTALLRVLLVVLSMSSYSLSQARLPDGDQKRTLLRAIDRSRTALPLRSVLRMIRLARSSSILGSEKTLRPT